MNRAHAVVPMEMLGDALFGKSSFTVKHENTDLSPEDFEVERIDFDWPSMCAVLTLKSTLFPKRLYPRDHLHRVELVPSILDAPLTENESAGFFRRRIVVQEDAEMATEHEIKKLVIRKEASQTSAQGWLSWCVGLLLDHVLPIVVFAVVVATLLLILGYELKKVVNP